LRIRTPEVHARKDSQWERTGKPDQALPSWNRGKVSRQLRDCIHGQPHSHFKVLGSALRLFLFQPPGCIQHSSSGSLKIAVPGQQPHRTLGQPVHSLPVLRLLAQQGGEAQRSFLTFCSSDQERFVRSETLDHLQSVRERTQSELRILRLVLEKIKQRLLGR